MAQPHGTLSTITPTLELTPCQTYTRRESCFSCLCRQVRQQSAPLATARVRMHDGAPVPGNDPGHQSAGPSRTTGGGLARAHLCGGAHRSRHRALRGASARAGGAGFDGARASALARDAHGEHRVRATLAQPRRATAPPLSDKRVPSPLPALAASAAPPASLSTRCATLRSPAASRSWCS